MKRSPAEARLVPFGVVTVTSTVPGAPAGAMAVRLVPDVTSTPVAAAVPNWTAVAPVNPVPVTVAFVPPVVGPNDGVTPVTWGRAAVPAAEPARPDGWPSKSTLPVMSAVPDCRVWQV